MENKETKDTKETNDRKTANEKIVLNNKLKDAKKEGITKGALTSSIIGLILLVGLGILAYLFYRKDHNNQLAVIEDQRVNFTEQLVARDSMINEWLMAFDEIERDLRTIKEKENLITMGSSDSEFTKDRKDQVLEDIKTINALLEANKKRIASLSAQLKESGGTIKGFQERIASLEASIQQYETEIADLRTMINQKDFEIGQLNTRVTALKDTINMQVETISDQVGRINTAYVIYGTFKDLKEKGLVSKEGGFLGIGRKESLIEDFADSLFSEIDVRQTTTIPVNSKSAKLITDHPTDSYELIPEGEKKIAYIEIKDPEEFWKISKYAVVELIK
jgi:peptidoglycan hydrolase CwlO-like protein